LPQLRLASLRPDEGTWLFLGKVLWMGHDKGGRPIAWQRAGAASQAFSDMYARYGRAGILENYTWSMELQLARMEEASEYHGQPIARQVVIFDLKGLSYRPDPRAIAVYRDFMTMGSRYYPETLEKQFIINAPWFFSALWRVLRTSIDPTTAAKFHVLGANFKSALLECIDASNIPVEYGGTNTAMTGLLKARSIEDADKWCLPMQHAVRSLAGRKRHATIVAPFPTQTNAKKTDSHLLLISSFICFILIILCGNSPWVLKETQVY